MLYTNKAVGANKGAQVAEIISDLKLKYVFWKSDLRAIFLFAVCFSKKSRLESPTGSLFRLWRNKVIRTPIRMRTASHTV